MTVAIITDIHEDLINLEKAFQLIDKRKCDSTICLGDISGYSVPHYSHVQQRDAHACLELIKAKCDSIILGNHDLHAAGIIPPISPKFNYPIDWYKFDYKTQKKLSRNKLWLYVDNELDPGYIKADLDFLSTLEVEEIMSKENANVLLSHYIYPNLTGSLKEYYLYPKDFAKHFGYMEKQKCKFAIAGHAHTQGLHIIKKKKVIKMDYSQPFLLDEPSIVMCPSVSGGPIRNGFLIFDIQNSSVEAVQI